MSDTAEIAGTSGAVLPSRTALKTGLRRSERRNNIRALGLMAPLLVFMVLNFLLPISFMMLRSVSDPELSEVMPRTAAAISQWTGSSLPDDDVAAVFAEELLVARENRTLSLVANRLNYDINGFRSLIFSTARRLPLSDASSPMAALAEINSRWADPAYWNALRQAVGPYTSFYLLAAVDRRLNADGQLVGTPPEQAIFVDVFLRTFGMSTVVTLACLVLGYPVAYLLTGLPPRLGNWLIVLVVLPLWTPVLVRITAWVVLLQREGTVNDLLQWLGMVSQPVALVHNRTGVYIAMIHVLLPFMVLPLYGVMKGIDRSAIRAALSLGARPFVAFLRVYLPQTLPGISAGCLLVFILSIGFYLVPALVGGPGDQMVSSFIAFYTNQTLNWGLASALGLVLLVVTLALYFLYNRLTGSIAPRWT